MTPPSLMSCPAGSSGADAPAGEFSVDIERVIYDLNRTFNPLHRDQIFQFRVLGVRDGYAFVTFALPVGMTRAFTSLLESLYGLFRFVDFKAKCQAREDQPLSPAEVFDTLERQELFRNDVLRIFDELVSQGVEVKEAVKRTNRAMKEQKHPWATHDLVSRVLSSSGRFKKRR